MTSIPSDWRPFFPSSCSVLCVCVCARKNSVRLFDIWFGSFETNFYRVVYRGTYCGTAIQFVNVCRSIWAWCPFQLEILKHRWSKIIYWCTLFKNQSIHTYGTVFGIQHKFIFTHLLDYEIRIHITHALYRLYLSVHAYDLRIYMKKKKKKTNIDSLPKPKPILKSNC